MRRSKTSTEYYQSRIDKLFQLEPSLQKVENRYKTLLILLQRQHPLIIQSVSKESMMEFLKDVLYVDREIRRKTEGQQSLLKHELAVEVQQELGYEQTP